MEDIIIYTTEEVLAHKRDRKDCDSYYWEFSRMPKFIEVGSRIYFATKGFIRGYFVVKTINGFGNKEVAWSPFSWRNVKPIAIKQFRGFQYYYL